MLDVLKVFIAISGMFCVLFSAWMSHAAISLAESQYASLTAALNIQFLHTIALLSLYVWYNLAPQKSLKYTLCLFVSGIVLFSGSIYLKTLTELSMLGKFAPIGGVILALAWLSLILQRNKS
jgi:uncharacterized membrane protein YgdD (TMEM256/DUF423 family)